MNRNGRRVAGWSGVAVAILIGALLFRTGEPARTALELVAAVCSERSPREREREIAQHVAESLSIDVEDAEAGWLSLSYSRVELLEQLAQLDATRPRCQLRLDDWSTGSGPDGAEWLTGQLEFSDSQAGDLHAERRSLRAQFRRVGDERRLERIRLGAPERRLPEARP
jgi:hypothetical protein